MKKNEEIKKQNRLMKKTNRAKIIALSGAGLFLSLALFSTLVNGADVRPIRATDLLVVSMSGEEQVVDLQDEVTIGNTAAPLPRVKILNMSQSPLPDNRFRCLIIFTLENLENKSVNVTFENIWKFPAGRIRKVADRPMQFNGTLGSTSNWQYPLFRYGTYTYTLIVKLTSTGTILDQKSVTWVRHRLSY